MTSHFTRKCQHLLLLTALIAAFNVDSLGEMNIAYTGAHAISAKKTSSLSTNKILHTQFIVRHVGGAIRGMQKNTSKK